MPTEPTTDPKAVSLEEALTIISTGRGDETLEKAAFLQQWEHAAGRQRVIARLALAHHQSKAAGTTHAPGCWSWGPEHYQCAVEEIKRAQARDGVDREALARIIDPHAFSRHASCVAHYLKGNSLVTPMNLEQATAVADTAWGGTVREALTKADAILALLQQSGRGAEG